MLYSLLKTNSGTRKSLKLRMRHLRNTLRTKYYRVLIFSTIFVLLLFIHLINFEIKNNVEIVGWSKNVSRDIADYLLPNENTTLIEPTACHILEDPILLLIVVCSSAGNFETRQTIRKTWGNTTQFNYQIFDKLHGSHNGSYLNIDSKDWRMYAETSKNSNSSYQTPTDSNFRVKVVFLLGVSTFEDQQSIIDYEHEKYGDIIQEDFLDSYNNLTLKSIFMLKWIQNNCIDKVKFIMKCDDDMFINVPNLIHVLLGGTVPFYESIEKYYDYETIFALRKEMNRLPHNKKLLFGSKFFNATKVLDPISKYYAPDYMYSEKNYPYYLSGTAYVFTTEIAEALYNGSLSVPLFHMEDVYLTGLVAEKMKIERIDHPLFFHCPLKKDKCIARAIISQHRIAPSDMQELYNFANDFTIDCDVSNKTYAFIGVIKNLAKSLLNR